MAEMGLPFPSLPGIYRYTECRAGLDMNSIGSLSGLSQSDTGQYEQTLFDGIANTDADNVTSLRTLD